MSFGHHTSSAAMPSKSDSLGCSGAALPAITVATGSDASFDEGSSITGEPGSTAAALCSTDGRSVVVTGAATVAASSRGDANRIGRRNIRKPSDRRIAVNSSPEQPTSDIMSGTTVKPPPSTDPAGRISPSNRGFQNTRSRIKSPNLSSISMRTARGPQTRKPVIR